MISLASSAKMEIVVAVAIAILGTIFLAATVALIVVCSKHYCRRNANDLISRQTRDSRYTSAIPHGYDFNVT